MDIQCIVNAEIGNLFAIMTKVNIGGLPTCFCYLVKLSTMGIETVSVAHHTVLHSVLDCTQPGNLSHMTMQHCPLDVDVLWPWKRAERK